MQFTLVAQQWTVPRIGGVRGAMVYLELKNLSDRTYRVRPGGIIAVLLRDQTGAEFGRPGHRFSRVPLPISPPLEKGQSVLLVIGGTLSSSAEGFTFDWTGPHLEPMICEGLDKGTYDLVIMYENNVKADDDGPSIWTGRVELVVKGMKLK